MRAKSHIAGLCFVLAAATVVGAESPWTPLGPYDQAAGAPVPMETVVAVPNGTTLYAAGPAGVFRSDDGGAHWIDRGNPGGDGVRRLRLDPLQPATLYAATNKGLFKTVDGGANWQRAGLEDQAVYGLALDPNSSSRLFAGTYPQAGGGYGFLFESEDGGATWREVDSGHYDWANSLAVDPLDPSTVFAGMWNGAVRRSTDGGATWSTVDQRPGQVWQVAADPARSGAAYMSWGTTIGLEGSIPQGSLRRTKDGAAWADVPGLPDRNAGPFLIDPNASNVLYDMANGSFYRSVDGGEVWGVVGPEAAAAELAISPGGESRYLYAAGDGGVLRYDLSLLPPHCDATPTTLCLQFGRFSASLDLTGGPLGVPVAMQAVPVTSDSGYFWFFGPENVELMVKVLDGTTVNDHYWVFYGALSNLMYRLTLTDTLTGATRVYENLQGTLASVADTQAFPNAVSANDVNARPRSQLVFPSPAIVCDPDPAALCLEDGRFQVRVAWQKTPSGPSYSAAAVTLTGDTGYFWFFDEANVELVVKVLDGTAVNGHHWVFYGALSDVEYTITVTDTLTGATRSYENARGTLASVADTAAF